MKNMKKIFFGLVLAGFSLSYAGDWFKIGACVAFPTTCAAYVGTKATVNFTTSLADALLNGEKQACGNKGKAISEGFATKVFIPDQFPPDEAASQLLVDFVIPGAGTIQACRAIATVDLSPACLEHDVCRESRGRTGTASSTCDQNMKSQWEAACRNGYGSADPCRAACLEVVDGSWEIMMSQLKQFDGIRSIEAVNYYYNR